MNVSRSIIYYSHSENQSELLGSALKKKKLNLVTPQIERSEVWLVFSQSPRLLTQSPS